ncbi:MAG TPA: hypothetical protein VK673_21835 [Chthoniobacterales bacterium]|nr:hypothetical protein [Chthoniobacterales bacterium]
MHGRLEGGNEGTERDHDSSREEIRPLSEREGFAIAALKLIAIAIFFSAIWVKIDAFQQASISLIHTIDEIRIKKSEMDQERSDKVLSDILDRVQKMADKTDAISEANRKLLDQTLVINKTQTDLLNDLKAITTSHTKAITETRHQAIAAKSAAQKAAVQAQKVQNQVASPWYKKVFK